MHIGKMYVLINKNRLKRVHPSNANCVNNVTKLCIHLNIWREKYRRKGTTLIKKNAIKVPTIHFQTNIGITNVMLRNIGKSPVL